MRGEVVSSERDELRETLQFEDVELIELDEDPEDLLAGLPDNPSVGLEATVARPFPRGNVHQAPTRALQGWDVVPPPSISRPEAAARASAPAREVAPRPHEEITAVRKKPDTDGAHWIDLHAVVGADGVLRLPEDVARRLNPGAIVEIRLAAWAVEE